MSEGGGVAVGRQLPQWQKQSLALLQSRTARVSDTLREGRGREERVGKALHDINNCMRCTSVPTGLCVMSLLCQCVGMQSISRAPSTEQYAERE